jgi:YidC/Oxa1 family membrane protein insertase
MVLCFLIFMGWQKFYIEPRMPKHPAEQSQTTAPAPGNESAPPAAAAGPSSSFTQAAQAQASHPTQTRTLTTETGDAKLGDGNLAFLGWNLKSYKLGLNPGAAAVDLNSVTNEQGQLGIDFDDPTYSYLSRIQGTFQDTAGWVYEDSNVKLKREIAQVPGEPYLNMTVTAEFKAHKPNFMFLSLTGMSPEKDPEAQDRQLLLWKDKSLDRVHLSKEVKREDVFVPVKYIAVSNRYFLMTLVNQSPMEAKAQVMPVGQGQGRVSLVYPVSGNSITIPLRVYFGPKELEMLRRVDPALDNTVDLGWFQLFAYPLLKLLKFFYEFLHNYGLAIILLTLLIKVVTFPLNYKSMKSMKDMARLQPQLAKIREKYKDDKEALNREMLSLMRTHGYNPAAGCLPMIIQMPIFFALYRVLYSSIELFHAPFAFWIRDLSARDPFYVTPVLLALTMFLQQKVSPQQATGDPTQQKMMQFMPLIFGFMMLNLPSGLTLYMLVNAIAGIGQQLFLNKRLDTKRGSGAVVTA